jgi:hypothetical protein
VSDTTDGNAPQSYWIWPSVGSAAVSYGLDSEIFDTEKFPHIETFVRETIQNSLDARFMRKSLANESDTYLISNK